MNLANLKWSDCGRPLSDRCISRAVWILKDLNSKVTIHASDVLLLSSLTIILNFPPIYVENSHADSFAFIELLRILEKQSTFLSDIIFRYHFAISRWLVIYLQLNNFDTNVK